MMPPDRIIAVDWSARATPSPRKPTADSIFICDTGGSGHAEYHRTRAAAMQAVESALDDALTLGQRVVIGFDFAFGYPTGFAEAVTGHADPLALWNWLAERVEDAPDNANNRFDVAAALNRRFPGIGPFWGRPAHLNLPDLPAKGSARHAHGWAERRRVEERARSAHSVWKLYTTGAVGSQTLLGVPHLARLRRRFGAHLRVWPFEAQDAPITLVEIYPTMMKGAPALLADLWPDKGYDILDARQVRGVCDHLRAWSVLDWAQALAPVDAPQDEGWILGVGFERSERMSTSRPPSPLSPPPLKNDCFALPPGHHWTPVEEALALLRSRLQPTVGSQEVPLAAASGRILAADVTAPRAHPPYANAAIDGYGLRAADWDGLGPFDVPLMDGRAAAGAPFEGVLSLGMGIRVLTGAQVPEGVDTLILEEDTAHTPTQIAFHGPLKPGANIRKAGEDMAEGAVILPKGQILTPRDLGMLASVGVAQVSAMRQFRIGVLSTGDEVVALGCPAAGHQIYDANRPMLLAQIAAWGMEGVDLGHVPDDRAALRARLTDGASRTDMILTSGGASAGDEDHVSALLQQAGAMALWRVAMKPGRPLALGLWDGVPVFGLPGNPVAAFVCALVFAAPSARLMAGAGWHRPVGLTVPAAFTKRKKAGRSEYLRARLTADGTAEVFASEGSGRISGLGWATGLVCLDEDARNIAPGDPVRYVPFEGF